jgi:hypothetical protein
MAPPPRSSGSNQDQLQTKASYVEGEIVVALVVVGGDNTMALKFVEKFVRQNRACDGTIC